jgi:hypothetical protein
MSLTKLSLDGDYDVIYKFFLHRESLVSDIPAGDGNIEKLFLQCRLTYFYDYGLRRLGVYESPFPSLPHIACCLKKI